MKYLKEYNEFVLVLESIALSKKMFLQTNKLSDIEFDKLLDIDPSPTKKYLEKICKYFVDEHKSNKVIDVIRDKITTFDSMINRKLITGSDVDINKYKTLKDIEAAIQKHSGYQMDDVELNFVKKGQAEVIRNDDKFFIVVPDNYEASCAFGDNTSWCTARKDDRRFWNSYYAKFIKIYYCVDLSKAKSNDMYKFAVAVYPDGKKECFDSSDDKITIGDIEKLGLKEELFKSEDINLENQIKRWFKDGYTIDENGFYSTDGDVIIKEFKGDRLPIKFKYVGGVFGCDNNKLISLEGCPEIVGLSFNCSSNKLTSLNGSPKKVGYSFDCYGNKLTSLEFSPETVGGDFNCYGNILTSLEGGPKTVGGDFDCSYNSLTSLEGGPKTVGGDFDCSNNKLTSLNGSTEIIGHSFNCSSNKLKTLEGGPKKVGKNYNCMSNKLKSLKGSPKRIDGDDGTGYFGDAKFDCSFNELTSLKDSPEVIDGDFNCNYNNLTSLESSLKIITGLFSYDNNDNLPKDAKIPKHTIRA